MTLITSPQNTRLKALKRLATRRERERSGRFLAEGEDLVLAAERAGREAVEGFRLNGSGLGGPAFHDVELEALRSASTLGSGARVIGVYEQRWTEPAGPLCIYLHGVGDPGNVGTVMRSAQAFGASCVALGPGCADPHSPKAVRASMGAIFSVALARVRDLAELPGERVALLAGAREVLRAGTDAASLTLLVGAERDGLPAQLVAACERSARIPIASESLNAAMAATVALYEVTRETPGAGAEAAREPAGGASPNDGALSSSRVRSA
ncbi:MAG TPA: RNA methyltransferase [Solirubrobacteraceae bacterium]|jgi:TrmH family RNA methyltransferase|nr:RNA methyltransferase [Solirubrobacteraceae bacterium]